MPTGNPYERRDRRENQHWQSMQIGQDFVGVRSRARSPISMDDVGELVQSAVARAEEQLRDRFDADRTRFVGDARREAWAQGYAAGGSDGRMELLERIDQQFGVQARLVNDKTRTLITAAGLDTGEIDVVVTRKQLIDQLDELQGLLAQVIQAHHDGFVE